MSKYEIKHTCGHTETVQIYGTNVHGERDRKKEWMESKPCRECERKARIAAGEEPMKKQAEEKKDTVFTEQNKQDFPKLLSFMRERLAGNADHLAAVDKMEAACKEHMDDFSICTSGTLSNAIGEVWQLNYSRKYSGCKSDFVSVFKAAIAAAKMLDL